MLQTSNSQSIRFVTQCQSKTLKGVRCRKHTARTKNAGYVRAKKIT